MTDRHAVHFTSARTESGSDLWQTPLDLFDRLDAEFHFDLDAAASEGNALCPSFYTADGFYVAGTLYVSGADALSDNRAWPHRCVAYLNPPYSMLREFLARALAESRRGCTVVALVPARTDTRAWAESAWKAAEVRFITGRLRFGGASASAPFPSAILVFRPGHEGPPTCSLIPARFP